MHIRAPSSRILPGSDATLLDSIAFVDGTSAELFVSDCEQFGQCFEIVSEGRVYDVGVIAGDYILESEARSIFIMLAVGEAERLNAEGQHGLKSTRESDNAFILRHLT